MGPFSSSAIKKLIDNYLDSECFAVIEGGIDVAIEITKQPWNLICFTGST